MRKLRHAVVAAAVAMATAGAADAAIIISTWTGTVTSGAGYGYTGVDAYGYFGAAGDSLVGETFTLKTEFDTSFGNITNSSSPYAASKTLEGGSGVTPSSTSPGKAWLTINGQTVYFGGSFRATYAVTETIFAPGSMNITQDIVEALNGAGPGGSNVYAFGRVPMPFDFLGPYDAACVDFCDTGRFSLTNPAGPTAGGLNFEHLTIAEAPPEPIPSPIPEPQTWALMLLGFGALGASLRRHRASRRRLAHA